MFLIVCSVVKTKTQAAHTVSLSVFELRQRLAGIRGSLVSSEESAGVPTAPLTRKHRTIVPKHTHICVTVLARTMPQA